MAWASTVGSLESGKRADFIAIDLNCPSMLPVYTYPMRNMVPNLVYSARGAEVSLVAVDGKVIMQDGTFTYVDEKEYLAAIPQYPDTIGERAAEEFFAINGTNAHFMRKINCKHFMRFIPFFLSCRGPGRCPAP